MSSSAGEKTEQPTEKRLRDAKKKGQVAKSQDLTGAVLLIAAVGTIWLIGQYMGLILLDVVRNHLTFAASFQGEFTQEVASSALTRGVLELFWVLLPLFSVIIVFALLTNYLQIGSVFSTESISPKFEKTKSRRGIQAKVPEGSVLRRIQQNDHKADHHRRGRGLRDVGVSRRYSPPNREGSGRCRTVHIGACNRDRVEGRRSVPSVGGSRLFASTVAPSTRP